MNRIDTLKFWGAAGALVAAPVIPAAHAARTVKPKDDRPNIIVFLVDDMGWMDCSCNGSTFYRTPNIDALAREGIRFTDAYAACTVSSPTRAALMTGKYPARLHLTDFIAGHDFAWAKFLPPVWTKYLPVEETTIAERLRDTGYHTWHVGKWHLGQKEEYFPENQGFEVNIGGCGAGAPGTPGPKHKGYFSPYSVQYNLEPGPEGEYLTDRLTDEAIGLIRNRKNDGRPFYLNMAHYAVHTPLQGKPEIVAKYESLADDENIQNNATYAAMIESMDESLGRIRTALEEEGLTDNTLIIFTSDNGALERVSSNHPLRGGKGTGFEGGTRVPFVAYWPGHVKPGRVSGYPIITMDITATLMDIAGAGNIGDTDGQSIRRVLEGKKMDVRPIYWHYPHYHIGKPYSAVRVGDWKLIRQLEDGSVSLYNLKKDLGETRNLSEKYPARTAELLKLLEDWKISVGAQEIRPNPDYDPDRADKKRSKDNKVPEKVTETAKAGESGKDEEQLLQHYSGPYKLDTSTAISETYRHDPDLKLYFIYPDEELAQGETRPAIVFFFGGGWTNGTVQAFASQGKRLAGRGMIAVLADYRVKTKYGTPPQACIEDAKSAMRYVRKNAERLHIDPSRIAAGGGSAGGHLAAATALVKGFDSPSDDLSVSPRPDALVLFNPVFNNAPAPEGYGYERIKEDFPAFSPAHNITPGAPPTLVMVGTKDHLIPVAVAEDFAAKMKAVGSRCELELYEGAGHGFFNYNYNRKDVPEELKGPKFYFETLARTERFLESLGYL